MNSTRPPNKRKLQAAATRERMLQAAREVFEAKGYRGTTVGAITSAADTAHGTFYLYFENKDDAFTQVMKAIGDEMLEAQRASAATDRWEGIEGVLRGFVAVFVQHPGLWRALLEGMLSTESIERMWLAIRAQFIERLARGLEREQEAGRVRVLDVRQSALALGSMAEWYSFTHLVLGAEHDRDEGLDVTVGTLTDLWYHAVYGRTDHTFGLPGDGSGRRH
jgi:AcrR family transcriptional regulator